jgi:uncharacterized phage protein (TIGR01671 family)
MSRIFKFRAWDIKENFMAKEIQTMYDGYCKDKKTSDNYGWMSSFTDFLEEWYIIIQYTGLKDKKGNEIYENDIVSYEDNVYQVIVNESMQIPVLESEVGQVPLYKCNNEIEVVGNIFEDAQLLG